MFNIHWTMVGEKRSFNLKLILVQVNYDFDHVPFRYYLSIFKCYRLCIIIYTGCCLTIKLITSLFLVITKCSKIILIIFSSDPNHHISTCIDLINSYLKHDLTFYIWKRFLSKYRSPWIIYLMSACLIFIWKC